MASYDDTATVSGTVVGFNNGADDVPIKNWLVTLPASLDGYTEVNGTKIPSRNMASMSDADFTLNNVQYSTENGVLHIDGTSTGETSSGNAAFKALDFWLPSGTYYFSRGATLTNLSVATYLRKYDDKTEIKANQGSFTLSENTHLYVSFYVYNKTFSNIKAEICINLGSTAITYEDTAPMTQYTANLGRTIYGGEVDIVNGTGKEQYQKVKVSDLTWQKSTASGKDFFIANISEQENANTHDVAIDITGLTYAGMVTVAAMNDKSLAKWLQSVRIYDTSVSTVSDLLSTYGNGEIVFYLKDTEQTDFTFDGQEIPTRLGVNNFWSEQGDTELTYYKDGYGFTSVTVHKETPEGEPVEQTAYLHKVIYGGQADVVKGTCKPKNLLDSADASHTFTSGTNNRYTIGTIALKGGVTYTFSAYQKDALTSNTRNTLGIIDNGNYTYEYATGSNYHNQSGVHSMQHTPNEDKTVTLFIWVHTPSNDVTYSEFQVEKGSSVSDFAPHFEPFSFPPISIGTDDGENTLFSNEGTSAITYRKETE